MTSPVVVPATIWDAVKMAPRLRAEDREEVEVATGKRPVESLLSACRHPQGRVWAIRVDERPIAMFGVTPHPSEPTCGIPWLLATPELLDHSVRFARESRKWVEELGRGYDRLMNLVYTKNTLHMRWLEWCGFEIRESHQINGGEFRRFERNV